MTLSYVKGRIDSFDPMQKCGKIFDGRQYYHFHLNAFKGDSCPSIGTQVKFYTTPPQNGGKYPVAKGIEIADIVGVGEENYEKKFDKFKKICTWQLEAKRDLKKSSKYFYHTNEAIDIETGDKCYVVGRKGSGKTAIAEYILRLADENTFIHMLNFKNFPFNKLYSLEDTSFQRPSQYISLWKYVVYSHVAMSMSVNKNIDADIRAELSKHYNNNEDESLFTMLSRWTKTSFNLFKNDDANNNDNWINNVKDLEDIISDYIDKSKYYIIFDALDDDYNKYTNQDSYFQLLTSLFKAVDSINTDFDFSHIKIMPIIFIRDDIYNRIEDNDKHKWDDLKITLSWDNNKIKNMLAHRISKTLYEHKNISFDDAYNELFSSKRISSNDFDEGQIMSVFDDLSRRTFMRPRDFIMFFTCMAKKAMDMNMNKISYNVIKECYYEFSQSLIDELNNEMLVELNNFEEILCMVIKQGIRSYEFNSLKFIEVYDKYKLSEKTGLDGYNVLNILYKFSVIGNLKSDGKLIYKYQTISTRSKLNLAEIICVHEGIRSYLDAV